MYFQFGQALDSSCLSTSPPRSSRTWLGWSRRYRGTRWSLWSEIRRSESRLQTHFKVRDQGKTLFTPGQDTKLVQTLSLTQTMSAPASRSVPLLQMKLTALQPASSKVCEGKIIIRAMLQGLYRDVKTSSNTKRIEYYDVSLNQFAAASHSHTAV